MNIADSLGGASSQACLRAPDRSPMTYGDLRSLVEATGAELTRLGFHPLHRIAVVLPNGPELAAAFVALSAHVAFAPLNPAYSAAEFRFYLQDLEAAALVTIPGFCPAAEESAESLSVPVLEFRPDTYGRAGAFTLHGSPIQHRPVDEVSCALLLHTSGSTARPKLVGLTHGNLTASARQIASTLRITADDITLNVMPLFHIHGLIGSLLSSLTAGGSVYCSPGFNALRFARWIADSDATWYSAVPTMHQALLTRWDEGTRTSMRRLRFVRSSSAHLHTRVWKEMEEVIGCPVLNAYGMTEASHQVACNPLPPGQRQYGTVGLPHGPEVAILNEKGEPQPAGAVGEVGIRGASVTRGYLSPVEANRVAFVNGWLRTGDEGMIDERGYVTLTGRLKELVNSGGEKISPAEIDSVLMQHPAVAQAVAFGAPCDKRGERVCAAVVLQHSATETDLRNFVRERLAPFKVPSKVFILRDLPKGPSGKLQRNAMAKLLGVD